ncbi:MAG: hypothetical protein KC458_07510 [Dehalococcoidia bacterium]|nr:hypothetical protein [Dehalococcoidia bacterium]
MSLLSQQKREAAYEQARQFRARRTEAARSAYYGVRDGKVTQLPIGLKRLETPEQKDIWKRFMSRQAVQEQSGAIPSDIASTAIAHPAVQQAFAEEVQ